MAKTNKQGPSFTDHEKSDPAPPAVMQRAELGRADQSPGTDSSESYENESTENEVVTRNPQERALTTENPSDRPEMENPDVRSADTGTQSNSEKPYAEWDYRELQAECKERELPANGTTEDLIQRLEDDDVNRSNRDGADEDDFQ